MSADQKKTLPFLLEIGTEEIPARFIPSAMADLERMLVEELAKAHLPVDGVRVLATPRRLTLMIEELAVRQPDRALEIKGPPVSVAFDGDGKPTPAAQGFAKKAGLALEDCERGSDKRGEFLLAKVTETGRPAAEVLAEIVPKVVLGIPFRKTMRWGDQDVEYPRPLQWILMLHGAEVVEAEVGGVASGRNTRGHRTLSRDKVVEVGEPGDYISALLEIGVMVDHHERRSVIAAGLQAELEKYGAEAQLVVDDELLNEVVFLCEYPTPFLGSFSDEYLVLPGALITTALKSHQRYFSISKGDSENLLPCFAAVRDGGPDHMENVIKGNERVLHARLADALFYWSFDQQKTPDERTAMLAAVTWIEGYGSVLEKTQRLTEMSAWLWQNGMGDGKAVPVDLTRAATISKSDLVSEMIKDGKEFTKLEGFIGARYAALAGESEQVCRSIERQYFPRSATGELPGDQHAAILSVADRLDNVAGCWLAGFVPTGAKDPYALRRHVLAMLRILIARGVRIDLSAALSSALKGVAGFASDRDLGEVQAEIEEFVKTRLGNHLVDVLKVDSDVTRAVLPLRWNDPGDALAWVKALAGYREKPDFQLLATGFKRCRNILKGDTLAVADLPACRQRWLDGGLGAQGEALQKLPEPLEQELLQRVVAAVPELVKAEAAGDYEGVFATLSGLGPTIDAFFEGVRVNADDEDLKVLRIAFLREIHGLFRQYAEFAEVAAS